MGSRALWFVVGALVGPMLSPVLRPVVRHLINGGLLLGREIQKMVAEGVENLSDMAAGVVNEGQADKAN